MTTPWVKAYEQLPTLGLWLPGPWRERLLVEGGDRLRFLQSFCTNDLSQVSVGDVIEAFFLNSKGHILAHTMIAIGEAHVLIYPLATNANDLSTHLDHYRIREDVKLQVVDSHWWLALGGEQSQSPRSPDDSPRKLELGDADYQTFLFPLLGVHAWIVESGASQERIELAFEQAGYFRPAGGAVVSVVFDALRVESGLPLLGVDYFAGTLPQELDRNSQALNLQKGCYLGQETVARIDALGHVNKLLRGVRFAEDSYPYLGITLEHGIKQVGILTSLSYSPYLGTSVGLALLRREAANPGTALSWANGSATVIELPVAHSS